MNSWEDRPLYYFLDANNEVQPCYSVTMWSQEFRKKNRFLAQTQVGAFWVSTVFLGIDHGWIDGTPLLFETMVFESTEEQRKERKSLKKRMADKDDNAWSETEMRRYATYAEAMQGHREIVAKLESLLNITAEVKHDRQEPEGRG